MKTVKSISVILANYIPFLCGLLLYRNGAPLVWTVFIVLQVVLTVVNTVASATKREFVHYTIHLIISTILANAFSTYLYYSMISSDSETIAVGHLGLVAGILIVAGMALPGYKLTERE